MVPDYNYYFLDLESYIVFISNQSKNSPIKEKT